MVQHPQNVLEVHLGDLAQRADMGFRGLGFRVQEFGVLPP